ncbi:MAG: cysteine synthase A [Methanomassiliicoccales archaeon PtaU1.Bin124]|nr:MAG: cysteine synthase A [Methanomassiliicoccales archaeon PtaU1.Bin124]
MIYDNILKTIGRTPIVRVNRMAPEGGAEVYVKVESFNPTHSVKDRAALTMIEDAEKSGALRPGMSVVEPTSGNTGIGLAMVCAVKGYRLVLTMPENMSIERCKILKAFGAELVLTPAAEQMGGAVNKAKELFRSGGYYLPNQFENMSNVEAHYMTTAMEILADIPDIDLFVAGVGTGGTLTGVAKRLKETRPGVWVVGVEPATSAVLGGGRPGPHRIQGIGAGFVPKIYDRKFIDWILPVKDEEAYEMARRMAREEGILAGISGGAALSAGLGMAKDLPGKKVLILLPDSGERYLSTDLFTDG